MTLHYFSVFRIKVCSIATRKASALVFAAFLFISTILSYTSLRCTGISLGASIPTRATPRSQPIIVIRILFPIFITSPAFLDSTSISVRECWKYAYYETVGPPISCIGEYLSEARIICRPLRSSPIIIGAFIFALIFPCGFTNVTTAKATCEEASNCPRIS